MSKGLYQIFAGELTIYRVLGICSYHHRLLGNWCGFQDSQDCLEVYQLDKSLTHEEKRTNDQLSSVVRLIAWTSLGQVSGGKRNQKGVQGRMLNNLPRAIRPPPYPNSGDGTYLPIPFACTVAVHNVPPRHILNLWTKGTFLALNIYRASHIGGNWRNGV